MTARINIFAESSPLLKQFQEYSNAVQASGLDKRLIKLVEIRASQINGCANCLNMHSFEAHQLGETDQRLHLVAAWRDAPVFTDRERAALDWTEHLTLVAEKHAPDEVYEALDAQFTKEEQFKLTMSINVINSWNRLCVGFNLFVPALGWESQTDLKIAI